MRSSLITLGISLLATSAAFAEGGHAPQPLQPITVDAEAYDWSGGYVGLGFSQHQGEHSDFLIDLEDTTAATIFAGYAFQSGGFVYGGEISYSAFEQDYVTSSVDGVENMLDISVRVGYAFDNILIYGLTGHSQANTYNVGPGGAREQTAYGYHHGIGITYGLSEQFDLGLLYVMRDLTFDGGPGNPPNDLEHSTISLRAAFRF